MAEDMSKTGTSGEKTLIRDISFCGVPENGSNASMVDVKDGKIIRIRPMHYDWKYDPKKDMNPWKMEVRGSTFEPSMKTLIPPYSIAYKKRVYSPARIRYPMKRVDCDPNGERNPQNRGKSKYVRISWDEALDIIAGEMNRIKEKYGPTAILYQCDQHGENKVVQACHGAGRKLLRAVGRLHPADPPARQLGRLVVGQQALLGLRAGRPGHAEQPALRHRQERRAAPVLGLRPGDHAVGLAGPAPEPPELLVDASSASSRSTSAPTSTTPPPCTPTGGSRCCPTPTRRSTWPSRYQWFKDGTYDKEYLETHAVGVDKYEAYVMGDEDGVAEDAGVGGADLRRPGVRHQGPGRGVGEQAHHRGHRQRRPRHPRPVRHRAGPSAVHLPGHAGPGQAGRQPGQDDRVGPVRQARPVRPAQAAARALPAQGLHRRPSRRDQPPVVHPQDLRAQGHPRGRVRLVGLRVRDRRPRNQFVHYKYPADGCSKIHMVWTDSPCWITCWNTGNDYVRAMRHPTSSSCSPSTPGWRTTACWPTSSSR